MEAFYRRARLDVEAVQHREIACETAGGVMHRHESVPDAKSLARYAYTHRCLHLYHSVAYYRVPWARKMEDKAMFDSDLVVDVDAKPGRDCGTVRECLEKAFGEALRIRDALRDELGLDPIITFSGSKGFHVRVHHVGPLDDETRQALATYLLEPRQISEAYIGRLVIDLSRYSRQPLASLVDRQVLLDRHRLIRVVGSMHGGTGLRVVSVRDGDDIDRILYRASWADKLGLKAEADNCDSPWGTLNGTVTGQQALYVLFKCRGGGQ